MLIPNWRKVTRHAWSVRLLALAAVLSGIEVALPLIGYRLPMPDLAKAAVFFVITAGAFVARFVAQKQLSAKEE